MFATHSVDGATAIRRKQPRTAKTVEGTGDLGGNRLPIACVQDRIVRDFERGLSLRAIGREYVGVGVAAVEVILRERLRTLEAAVRRSGMAATMLLCCALGLDAFAYVVWGDAPAVERSFRVRGRRSRRRRDEASHHEVAEGLQNGLRVDRGAVAA
jgi:hypothetical protein